MRSMGKFSAAALVTACLSAAFVFADEPTTKPAKESHGPRLIKPYAEMKTLTADEKEKIADIHKKAREAISSIEEKEQDDIKALLTAEQKAELETLQDSKKVKSKGKAADKKAKATTEPAM